MQNIDPAHFPLHQVFMLIDFSCVTEFDREVNRGNSFEKRYSGKHIEPDVTRRELVEYVIHYANSIFFGFIGFSKIYL